jgi:hypothetical protein
MLWATDAETGEEWYSADIQAKWREEGKEYQNERRKHNWVCCLDCNDGKGHPVTIVSAKEYTNPHNPNKQIYCVAHFSKDNADWFCPGESDEHKAAKGMLISAMRGFSPLKIDLGGVVVPASYLVQYLEPPSNLSKEVVVKTHDTLNDESSYRKGDVVFNFKEFSPIFGRGIVFENQFSKISQVEQADRNESWIRKLYSVVWIPKETFDFTTHTLNTNLISLQPWLYQMYLLREKEHSETENLIKRIVSVSDEEYKKQYHRIENMYNEWKKTLQENKLLGEDYRQQLIRAFDEQKSLIINASNPELQRVIDFTLKRKRELEEKFFEIESRQLRIVEEYESRIANIKETAEESLEFKKKLSTARESMKAYVDRWLATQNLKFEELNKKCVELETRLKNQSQP